MLNQKGEWMEIADEGLFPWPHLSLNHSVTVMTLIISVQYSVLFHHNLLNHRDIRSENIGMCQKTAQANKCILSFDSKYVSGKSGSKYITVLSPKHKSAESERT